MPLPPEAPSKPSLVREIDDGILSGRGDKGRFRSNLNQFIDPSDPVGPGHVVLWYGGHCEHSFEKDRNAHPSVTHKDGTNCQSPEGVHGHWVGFRLKPVP